MNTVPMNVSWDTLDEPIWNTVRRDLSNIVYKLQHVLMPLSGVDVYINVCKNWDLWGPFIFCSFIAFSANNSSSGSNYHQSNFSSIFTLMWIGNLIISINYQLLLDASKHPNLNQLAGVVDSNNKYYPLSIFQLLCLFGYCLAIPSIGILIIKITSWFFSNSSTMFAYEKFLTIIIFCFLYPILSAISLLSNNIPRERYFLVVYPILLYFLLLSFYVYTFV